MADDVELLALVRRETGKVRVGQGRVDDARVGLRRGPRGSAWPPAWSTRRSTSRPGWPSAPPSRATWRERSSITEEAIATATRIGHETALGDLHCLRGSLLLQQERHRDAEQEFQRGLDSPDAGEGGCVRALNLLGRSLARAGAGRPDEKNLHAALATLRELGVEVLPHRLGHWVA